MPRKKGANNNEQNFIKRCVKEEVDWDAARIASHLLIEESVVQGFYDTYVKELEDETSDSKPKPKPKKGKGKGKEEEGGPTAEEEFD